MPEILTIELKSDLLRIYKTAGDLLNNIEMWKVENKEGKENQLLELICSKLMDITGTLQKDIFNCDYLETKTQVLESGAFGKQESDSES